MVSTAWFHGPGSLLFGSELPTPQDLVGQVTQAVVAQTHQEIFASFQLGLELRLGSRIGAGFFLETSPALSDARAIGKLIDFGFIAFQSFGAEVSFCF
jgi:hypothetical protein